MQRYYTDKTARALEILGFNVRNTDGGTQMFCIHTITKAELWFPKSQEGLPKDVVDFHCSLVGLPTAFFLSVYKSVNDDNLYPQDQH